MITVPSTWRDAWNNYHQGDPWLWCWSIILGETASATPRLNVVAHPEPVTVGGLTYNPFGIEQTPLEFNAEGQLPQMQLVVDNTNRVLGQYIQANDDFLGGIATVRIVMKGDLSTYYELEFTVAGCTLTTRSVSLNLEIDNFFDRNVPLHAFSVNACGHEYGGTRCGYVINAFAAYPDECPRTVAACKLRDADMRSRGLGRMLQRFGGFLGIPVQ